VVASALVPVLVDGDGLSALGGDPAAALAGRLGPTVLTPHDGEFARLAGHPPGDDRLAAARGLAASTGAVVLLKGPTTVVAHPDGRALLSTAGDARLATAGTGDVLSGVIGALLAQGVPAFEAAASGAWLHGRAAMRGPRRGLVASDVVGGLPAALDELESAGAPEPGAASGGTVAAGRS
jgi:ADP-dependent NAD(P)H-hydrate dehydratase / NAD(P)H-hydrate epimerase